MAATMHVMKENIKRFKDYIKAIVSVLNSEDDERHPLQHIDKVK